MTRERVRRSVESRASGMQSQTGSQGSIQTQIHGPIHGPIQTQIHGPSQIHGSSQILGRFHMSQPIQRPIRLTQRLEIEHDAIVDDPCSSDNDMNMEPLSLDADPSIKSQKAFETQLWIDKFAPLNEHDLAVHKRKVKDVRDWLYMAGLAPTSKTPPSVRDLAIQRKKPKLLVLTGPSGAGKTATLRVLAKEMDFDIVEWENPVNVNSFQSVWQKHENTGPDGKQERWGSDYVPALARFQEFFANAATVPSLTFTATNNLASSTAMATRRAGCSRRKLILIEDWPQLSTSSSRLIVHTCLRQFMDHSGSLYPVVLIISEISDIHLTNSYGQSDAKFNDVPITIRTVIPPEICSSPQYKHIIFNPVAPTIMSKALTRVCDIVFHARHKRLNRPSKQILEWICSTSSGDVRHALHRLQFLSLIQPSRQSTLPRGMSSTQPKRRAPQRHLTGSQAFPVDTTVSNVGGKHASLNDADCRDESVNIFQAIGRAIYNKRLSSMCAGESMLHPVHKHHERLKLQVDPEVLFNLMYIDPDVYILFIEQNMPLFFGSIEKLGHALGFICESDVLYGSWEFRKWMATYAMSVCTRGLLFSHPSTVTPHMQWGSQRPHTQQTGHTSTNSSSPQKIPKSYVKPEEFQCRARKRDNQFQVQGSIMKECTDRYLASCNLVNAQDKFEEGFAISNSYTGMALWLELVPFMGLMGRTNKHAALRNMPVHSKTTIAAVCAYGSRSVAEHIIENSYIGGIEYLDAIEDTAPVEGISSKPNHSRRPIAFGKAPVRSRNGFTWDDHLVLVNDDIEEFK